VSPTALARMTEPVRSHQRVPRQRRLSTSSPRLQDLQLRTPEAPPSLRERTHSPQPSLSHPPLPRLLPERSTQRRSSVRLSSTSLSRLELSSRRTGGLNLRRFLSGIPLASPQPTARPSCRLLRVWPRPLTHPSQLQESSLRAARLNRTWLQRSRIGSSRRQALSLRPRWRLRPVRSLPPWWPHRTSLLRPWLQRRRLQRLWLRRPWIHRP